MAYAYVCTFNLQDCIKTLGLEERGRVQQYICEEIINLSEPYTPFAQGDLIQSAHIEDGTDVVWSTPYARYQYNGKVWIDPAINASGFKTENGWRCTKDAQKIPTDRNLKYQGGKLRGSKWVDRMMQNGGREKIEAGAREKVKK